MKGRTSWLKNTEVLDLLQNYREYRFTVSREAPNRPPGWEINQRCLPVPGQSSMAAAAAAQACSCLTHCCSSGGSFFMFNRRATRFFRKDGHDWRKKADGKTVKETHEKLKVRPSLVACKSHQLLGLEHILS